MAYGTEDRLEVIKGCIRKTCQGFEDDLTWRDASQHGHQDVYVFGQLNLGSVNCLLVR